MERGQVLVTIRPEIDSVESWTCALTSLGRATAGSSVTPDASPTIPEPVMRAGVNGSLGPPHAAALLFHSPRHERDADSHKRVTRRYFQLAIDASHGFGQGRSEHGPTASVIRRAQFPQALVGTFASAKRTKQRSASWLMAKHRLLDGH